MSNPYHSYRRIYPDESEISNPFEKSPYFIEFSQRISQPLNYRICKRTYVLTEEQYLKQLESGESFGPLFIVEGHPYSLLADTVNLNPDAIDFNTEEFLEYVVDALNEKHRNDTLKNIALNWPNRLKNL
jgi:hypothetical protein